MENFFTPIKNAFKRYPVVFFLGILLLVELLSLPVLVSENTDQFSQNTLSALSEEETMSVKKLSEIRGAQIDESAAAVVNDEACFVLPAEVWMFLLLAYIALLIFNFSFGFRENTRIQWFWELIYTLLFIFGWLVWDPCFLSPWFPFMLIESGLILFAIYAYLFEKKGSHQETLF